MKDTRVLDVADVLGRVRTVLGREPDRRADLVEAFSATQTELEDLHAAIGHVIKVCATD